MKFSLFYSFWLQGELDFPHFQIKMVTLENVIQKIDWNNDFDTESSDIEDLLPVSFQFGDHLNVSVTTNQLMDQCAD